MPATTHPHVALVQRMYECFNRADLATIKREIFSEDLVWRLPGHNPISGTKQGPDEVIAFFNQLNKSGIQVTLVNIDVWGEDTVVEVHRGQGKAPDGAVLDALNCTHYHIRNGRIADVQVYMSDERAADNFFWQAYKLKPIPDRLA